MKNVRFLFPLLAAYGLLLAAGNTALYYLTFGDLESLLSARVDGALEEALERYPDVTVQTAFAGRRGTVSGIALSGEALNAARSAVEKLATEGVPGVPFGLEHLKHEIKRRSSFHLFERDDTVYLRSCLPLLTLNELEESLYRVRGELPRVPLGPDGGGESGASVPRDDAQMPSWHGRLGDFIAYYFQPGRAARAEIRVVDGAELWLAGQVETEEERFEVERHALAAFATLSDRLRNEIVVAPRIEPFHIEVVEGVVSVEGMVPSFEIQERLFDWVRRQGAEGQSFANGLQVIGDAPAPDWLDRKPTFLQDVLSGVGDAEMVIGPQVVLLRGEVGDRAAAESLTRKLKTELSGREITTRLTYPGMSTVEPEPES